MPKIVNPEINKEIINLTKPTLIYVETTTKESKIFEINKPISRTVGEEVT